MTLVPFPSAQFDALALRFLDLAAAARQLAHTTRELDLNDLALHGQKLDEWLAHLEAWTRDAAMRVQLSQHRQAGQRLAASLATSTPKVPERAKKSAKSKRR